MCALHVRVQRGPCHQDGTPAAFTGCITCGTHPHTHAGSPRGVCVCVCVRVCVCVCGSSLISTLPPALPVSSCFVSSLCLFACRPGHGRVTLHDPGPLRDGRPRLTPQAGAGTQARVVVSDPSRHCHTRALAPSSFLLFSYSPFLLFSFFLFLLFSFSPFLRLFFLNPPVTLSLSVSASRARSLVPSRCRCLAPSRSLSLALFLSKPPPRTHTRTPRTTTHHHTAYHAPPHHAPRTTHHAPTHAHTRPRAHPLCRRWTA